MTLFYEGSDGTVINLMGDGVYAQEPETLVKNEWKYSTISGVNGVGRVKHFYKDSKEAPLTLGIMAEDKEQFDEIMFRIHRTFDRDIRRMKPGKLWWGDFYREVFAVVTTYSDFEELFESIDQKVNFLSVYDYWVRKNIFQYTGASGSGTDTGLDFPHDYPHDYAAEDVVEVIENDCIDAANFEIRFYGPVANPSVVIGDHTYEVFVTLNAAETAVINSLSRTVTKYDEYGNAENIFYLRGRDDYVFEKIPEGAITIRRNRAHQIDITIYDERGEPEWI